MSKFMILVFSLLGLISACVGQIVQFGQCDPDIQLVQNFNIDQFLGTWHEVTRLSNPNQNGDCSGYELTRGANSLEVVYSSVNANFLDEARGTVSQVNDTARVTLNITTFDNPMDFWILDTDYSLYSIAFSCENMSALQRRIHIWVLGRTRSLTAMSLAAIGTTIRNTFDIDPAILTSVDQSDESCYILPVIAPGQPIILPGQCDPNISIVQNFDVPRFLGTWHQIYSYYTPNSNGSCARADYSLGDGVVDVLNSQVVNRSLLTIEGTASVSSTDNSARLSVVFVIGGVPVTQELLILASDYTNYAISYTCVNVSQTEKQVFSWILSRTRQLSASSQTAVNQVINSYIDLNDLYYAQTDQSDAACFFFPDPVPGQTVVFRGQCETLDVQAMPSFDATRYMGLWHTMELYPSGPQSGTCSNAYYELIDGTVSVLNTHVINERLNTVTAVAVPVSTDGSAQLVVTFPVPDSNQTITTNYWVLGTDYTNYALVYSCSNVNIDEMRVTSWKLSRTKQLSQASATAINNIMNNVLVLEQRYYEPMDQSTAGCFYFPEPQPGVPVVFPGQCDPSVAVAQNLNFAQFQGTWYEIQAYPSAEQTGQCVYHQFAFENSTLLNLTTSSVTDQFLGFINGSVLFSNNDNSGNLTINIANADGSVTRVPFLVLSYDYNDYALAYACVNISDDFRGVWSWKLSRTQQLSAAANTAINSIVANNLVLDNDYYETIERSDTACAYLPVIAPGDTITLPGQCDTNITGIPNFNLARYSGRWRLIESYGSRFQSGTCNVAEYRQETTLSLGVTHSQVVDQDLRSISGTATVISNDGSGKLLFSFPSRTQTFEMTILDTDYDSYALAYGCVNVNTEQRTISSWKFSRTGSLSQVANNNINQIINSIEVLNNRYYYTVNRTDSGCFYYPPVDTSTGVRFRTACNQNIPVVANFQAGRYLGLWHDIESYPEDFQDGTCINALYTPGNDVDVLNTQVVNQTLMTMNGTAMVNTTDGTGILNVTFVVNGVTVTTNYLIMDTDYDTYAFVYSCRPIDDEFVQVTTWKLSRTKALPAAAATAINNVMNTVPVLDQRYFVARNQTPEGCFYYPEPQPGVQVEFPGQCDDSIAAVPNFDMTRFQGLWHEIQAYPKDDQPGQCINHRFTLNSTNTLALESSNVLGLALGVTNGNVTFNSTDGSGRLVITILSNIGEVIEIPYWIINTDYDNHALAYSCVNISSDFRRVWSWKLSRTQQLTAASNTAINNAMENINVLGNEYFEDIDQSSQACFHLPNIAPGEAVILPGQCDATISGIPNFNITRYLGRWRLIESYGSDFQVGTCNVARYTQESATTISVVNSQVVNQELASIVGTATLSSDGSGVLNVYFPSRDEYFNVTILDTDYDSYSFGYGCVNLINNQRRVYSWKMSRDNTLSQIAINNINLTINSIDVLHNPYYYSVDRSEASCFYFPQVDSSTGVRFRTACNQNIPVVVNFDAARYLGLWHDIESYPEDFQDGTCINALYTPGNDVDVLNTQVVNQTLMTMNGTAMVNTTDGTGILNVTFVVNGITVTTNYLIMATDYDTYAFVYSCRPIDDEYVQVTTWKLSRTKALPAAAATAINNVMNTVPVLDQRYFVARNQTPEGCFYYPEPQPGVQVEFPGQCDDNIAAVPNFDMTRFQGLWHEIQAYPKDDQPGQCINHRFTLNSTNTLALESSNVLGLALGVTNGNVTFNSTDGSGRLVITILSNTGEVIEIPYWIISTDYDNHALAYSCVNISSDFRRVWSWKLSRTQQLTAASNTAINNAMENINVLGNEYFEDIDQSSQACFHLPNIAPGEAVILPGQCDATISGIPNFNITRYLGRWRLIESYGSDFQVGTCNVARYTQESATTLSVVNSQVVNQELASIVGTATLSSNGSGVLNFYFPSRDEYFNVTILDTDYDSYSFGYGCVNLINNQRRVYSWKMSRDNTLSQIAINNINLTISSIDVLHNPYYYSVDRSDASCFYFPQVDSSTGVRFRTACNQNIPVVANFDAARYLGLWHDIESYPEDFQDGTCINALYTPGNDVDVLNTQVVNQTLMTMNGTAMVNTTDGTGILNVTFVVNGITVTTNYLIMATDYDTYAFVYSCRPIDDEYVQVTTWKLSRTKALPAAAATAINNVMNTVPVLDQRYFVARNQTPEGCFYYPEPQPGVQVEFPGQCDGNIAAVPNFDMTRFQGLWHEIQAYPKDDQPGQCINHRFTLSGTNTLALESSNVLGLALGVTNGNVTFNSTDGSGRLVITILSNIGEVIEIPYWIINTDYDNHALAYSCVNISSDFRRVWSWKLSRTQQLTAASNTAINTAIANINVLDNIYYEDIQQTDSACFYLPELGPNEPVILPGQCDPNIPVMQNFNASRYLGRWRLIETYYSDFQEGSCNAAEYSLANDGSVIVFNTKVVEQELSSITGSAVLASNDGSAKLLVSFPGTGTPSDYWILDSDYDSYALIYSCRNYTENQRRVWSWKMSRTNTLTASATTAINSIVNSIDVLNPIYFQSINRTDAGCFYYPTPDSGTNVIFPGQCNESIPVVTNFNANAYLGTWYDIESYPTNFQSGTCNTATYSLGSDSTILVQNTQVVNQVLQTTTGSAVASTTDGSAKLDVTFTLSSGNVSTKYWVLATDYTSYSLVYSCRNIDDEFRAVYSWKLGRQRTLPQAAVTAINNAISTVQVLEPEYFVQRQHTEEACFYYPDNQGGDVILNGQCDAPNQVPAITNFNPTLFAGTWYEIARFPSALQNGECTATQYSLASSNVFNVVQTSVLDEALLTTNTQGNVATDGRGVISVNINGVPFDNVYILGTDNSDYAVAYSCRNLTATTKQVYSWKLSRSRSGLSSQANAAIDQIVSGNIDLFEPYYRYTSQDDSACFYYPVFDQPPATIELPGPCNASIRGVPNFNAAAYLGRWFEVARYPQTAQTGQCNRAVYSDIGGGAVSVVNSQVVAESLASITGQATVASTDGSGQLNVVFIVGGETRTSNYYILSTDYNNYALVYSCVNLTNGNRQVGSWKLSRNRTLTAQASAAIDAVVSVTQGLNETYYQSTSQSDESCFYIPPVDPNQAPIFRGQCEDITGVTGFDANAFLGWWHEIERFPSDDNLGECLSSRYQTSGNTILGVDTSIFDLTAQTENSTVTISNDGRIRRVFTDGRVQDIWVLGTDYNNYALLYSCENVNDEYRRVWSAKHSKTRSLSQAAQNAMASIIQANRLLYPEFYLPVDQSDSACFHYPVQAGTDVILPGQCDTSIPVVGSFDISDFQGTWYHIQRYGAVGASSCVGTRLSHDATSGDIAILDYEVVGGELTTTEATGRVTSTDGSGRLTVLRPVAGSNDTTEESLYILTTDYEQYALMYSCVNVDAFHRQVRAWQLSRERSMSAAGVSAITSIINQRQELHLPYFNLISHQGECPEPSSAFLINSSIILVLVCAVLQLLW